MKLSISLPEGDVDALDRFVREHRLPSRSAALQQAVRRLVEPDLTDDYAAAFDEWESSGEAGVWAISTADGVGDAPR